DQADLIRSRALTADVTAAYQQVDATLGQFPGLSPRAALHLQELARLLPVMDSILDATEARLAATVATPVARTWDPTALREGARRLVEDLRSLVQAVNESNPAPAGRDDLIEDLNGLLDLIQGFDRMLSAEPSPSDLVESLRLVRSRTRPVEAR